MRSQYANPKMQGVFRITFTTWIANEHIRFHDSGSLHQMKMKATLMAETLQLVPIEDWSNGLFWSTRRFMSCNKVKVNVTIEHEKDWVKVIKKRNGL